MLKIAACYLFTLSFSYNGNASPIEPDGTILNDSGSPHPTLMPLLDLEQVHLSSDQAPSPLPIIPTESIETGEKSTGVSSPTPPKKRALVKRKSTNSKPKSITPRKEEEEKPNLSKDMKVESASPEATMLAAWAPYLVPKFQETKSEIYFAPQKIPAVYAILVLMAFEAKRPESKRHPLIVVPYLEEFIGYFGFLGMASALDADLKKALLYDEFKVRPNMKNAFKLLCVITKEDLSKILNEKDMDIAKKLLVEEQNEHFRKTSLEIKEFNTEKRPEQSTLAALKDEYIKDTESNFTTYRLISNEKPIISTLELPSKDKKKKKKEEVRNPSEIHFFLSVSRVKKEKDSSSSTPRRKGSGAKTLKKRSKSIKEDSHIATSSAPSQDEVAPQPITNSSTEAILPLPEEDSANGELIIESSSAPLEKEE